MGNIETYFSYPPNTQQSPPSRPPHHSKFGPRNCKFPTHTKPPINNKRYKSRKKPNPGTMENLHSRCKSVFPVCFEGARVMLSRPVSNNFQIWHTINLSSVTPSGYRFNATYFGSKYFPPNKCYPVLSGDIDASGNLNATIKHQFFQGIETKFTAQVLPNSSFYSSNLTIDKRGSDYTGSIILADIEPVEARGTIVLHYLQSVTQKLSLGSEFAYQHDPQLEGGGLSIFSIAACYSDDDSQISGTLGTAGLHLSYYHKASEQLQVGIQLEINNRMQEAVASIGYQLDLIKNDVIFRGHIDSNWLVGGVLEKKLDGLPIIVGVSGLANQYKNRFRVGIGVFVG